MHNLKYISYNKRAIYVLEINLSLNSKKNIKVILQYWFLQYQDNMNFYSQIFLVFYVLHYNDWLIL